MLTKEQETLYKIAVELSVNRSYYAAFAAARAVLILFGIDPKTHNGVKTMIKRNNNMGQVEL
ncbi:MAG: hypothetical protein A2Y62_20350 [Candidatus Fischerbacteria bacterium RBG_13_37_8]|uniref:HEPN domain-containing protein n=1 Tax=Candidatus Fischerbacteria bacterium RBG_13_37_8 TaxID=1817863 RepID=A0A1F5VVG7_9BACT|nr:MAG: hypothetical protein A2Y62_20350 [Candidatus Fischerbacteria bacterium RBG_13_37_8]